VNRVVYDSDVGRVDTCPRCGRRADRCRCARPRPAAGGVSGLPRDGVVRVLRDRKGRGGKVVTVIAGLPPASVEPLAAELKRLCGAGGTVKAGLVEIQGDQRTRVADLLRQRGYTVRLA
jgi:translation initiation factor 1